MPITTPTDQHTHTNKHMRTPIYQINSVMPEGNMEEVMPYLQKALGIPKISTPIRLV